MSMIRRVLWRCQYASYHGDSRAAMYCCPMENGPRKAVEMSDRLRWAREMRGFPTAEAFWKAHEDVIGVTAPGYRHHENGTRQMSYQTATKYAELLKISKSWLIFNEGQPVSGLEVSPDLRAISWAPRISWIQAGRLAEGRFHPPEGAESVPVVYHRPTIALTVEGTSMNRVAQPGDTLIVDYQYKTPSDRDILVVQHDGKMTVKRYRCSNGPVRLEPESNDTSHETIFPEDGFEIIGKVIYILTKA